MAKASNNKVRNSNTDARMAAARAAWLEEEDEAYHAQFDTDESVTADEKFYVGRTRGSDGQFENGIGISVADYY